MEPTIEQIRAACEPRHAGVVDFTERELRAFWSALPPHVQAEYLGIQEEHDEPHRGESGGDAGPLAE
jgi:hypothetical protein